jgi:hypothetical protein
MHATEKGLVAAILGGANNIALLRERGKASERWYQYVDRLFMPDLEKSNIEKLEDLDKDAKIERLEIR